MHPKGSGEQCLRFIFSNFLFVIVQSAEIPGEISGYRSALNIKYLIQQYNLYYYERLREFANKALNIYLLKLKFTISFFNSNFSQPKLFTYPHQ